MSFPAAQAIVRQKHQAKTHPSLGNSPFPVELTVLQCCLQQLACRSFAASHFVSHIPTKHCRTSKQRATLFLQNNTAVCPVFTDISQKHPRSCKDSFGGEAKTMCPSHSFFTGNVSMVLFHREHMTWVNVDTKDKEHRSWKFHVPTAWLGGLAMPGSSPVIADAHQRHQNYAEEPNSHPSCEQ